MNEDDPVPLSDKNESDEENTIPAPQIKIGADGEIIVDEKSLVIENKATKRDREALQATKLIDGDLSTAYGVYKRAKRAKDWSKEETLRFYKALNTLGTDFTIMSELFPGRNRRELKLKFKKEERMNRALIDRAIMQPIRFNIEELQLELNLDKKEQEDKVARQKEKERIRQDSNNKVTRKRTKNPLAGLFITIFSNNFPNAFFLPARNLHENQRHVRSETIEEGKKKNDSRQNRRGIHQRRHRERAGRKRKQRRHRRERVRNRSETDQIRQDTETNKNVHANLRGKRETVAGTQEK